MKTTQCDKVLRHIEQFGSISPQEAIAEYGIYRLASRISDLKGRGYHFSTEMRKGKNGSRYAVYSLAKEGN